MTELATFSALMSKTFNSNQDCLWLFFFPQPVFRSMFPHTVLLFFQVMFKINFDGSREDVKINVFDVSYKKQNRKQVEIHV